VLQKFLPAIFAIQRDEQLVVALGLAGRCALLPHLFASIDALVQAVDSYYESYHRVFGRRRHSKEETPRKATDWRHADNHDPVCASLLHFSGSF
jgi:hypothetical protein